MKVIYEGYLYLASDSNTFRFTPRLPRGVRTFIVISLSEYKKFSDTYYIDYESNKYFLKYLKTHHPTEYSKWRSRHYADPPVKDVKYCDECGTQLNDIGQCPVCDLGETDY